MLPEFIRWRKRAAGRPRAFCAAFATAGTGLAAAIEAQRAIATEDWLAVGEGFSPILVRMGLHTGEATERGGDYFGQPVNRVARIEAAGHGGEIHDEDPEATALPYPYDGRGWLLDHLGEGQLAQAIFVAGDRRSMQPSWYTSYTFFILGWGDAIRVR